MPIINLGALFNRRGYKSEADRARKAEAESRSRATTILDPSEVSGDYDAARALTTTLNGQRRPITLDDLRAFSDFAQKLGKRFKGGITAKGVIDHSRQEDRDRANDQIKVAVLVRAQSGVLHFVTNTGPDSDETRYHVTVEFPAFKAYAASPAKPDKLARAMLDGPLRFECNCKRHRYWFRYIATKGGFNAGRPETGYPKIRNPRLTGVACKHALRVMLEIVRGGIVRSQVAKMLAAAQTSATGTTPVLVSAKDAQAAAAKQVREGAHLRRRVETTAQRTDRIAKTPAARARALQAATREAKRLAEKQADVSRRELAKAFTLLQRGGAPLTKAMRDKLIAQLQAAKTID